MRYSHLRRSRSVMPAALVARAAVLSASRMIAVAHACTADAGANREFAHANRTAASANETDACTYAAIRHPEQDRREREHVRPHDVHPHSHPLRLCSRVRRGRTTPRISPPQRRTNFPLDISSRSLKLIVANRILNVRTIRRPTGTDDRAASRMIRTPAGVEAMLLLPRTPEVCARILRNHFPAGRPPCNCSRSSCRSRRQTVEFERRTI